MTMPAVTMLLMFVASVASANGPAPEIRDGLVHLHERSTPVENAKTFDMDIDEIERKGSRSTVRVTFRSGGSVSGPMFELAGLCAIAKDRHARYFRRLTDADEGDGDGDHWIYIVGFADRLDGSGLELPPGRRGHTVADEENHDDATLVWSRDDCRLLGFAH